MSESRIAESASVESLVAEVVDEFMDAVRRGERPAVEEYAGRHPQLAPLLRQVLPALQVIGVPEADSLSADDPLIYSDQSLRSLGDFRLLREIGRGGMGVVYEAEQVSLGRRVALKVLPFAAALDVKQLQRFKHEAQAAAHLHHQHIVPVYGVGCERGVHYYAMQFIEGQTLAALRCELRQLAAPSPPSPAPGRGPAGASTAPMAGLSTDQSTRSPAFFRTMANLGVQAAEALEHAHQLGVVHRDIKPANLLVDVRGNLWITDFGLARSGTDTGLTMSGDLVGTLRYMSPEQALGKPLLLDQRTDIYSLGATLYELLTLTPAFSGGDRQALLRQITFDEPLPLRRVNRAVPVELETIVQKAMSKLPEERYATAQELADDLRRFLADQPIRAKRPTLWQRARKWSRRHRGAVLSAGLVLVFAVIGLALSTLMIWREKGRTEEQRLRALEHAGEARSAAASAQQMATEAERQKIVALELLARSYEERGMRSLEEGSSLGLLDLLQAQRTVADFARPQCVSPFLWAAWQRASGGRLLQVVGHQGPVVALAFSPDGRLLATASEDGTARLWVTSTGLPGSGPLRHRAGVLAVAFSQDGRWLATGSRDGSTQVWDAATGEAHGPPLRYGPAPVNVVRFSQDGTILLSATAGFTPEGEQLAVPRPGRAAQLWNPSTGKPHGQLLPDFQQLWAAVLSRDGKLLATGAGQELQLWDTTTGKPRGSSWSHANSAQVVAFSPDRKLVACATPAGHVHVWRTDGGSSRALLLRVPRWATDLQFSPDGKLLATASVNWTVQLWEVATGEPRAGPLRHGNRVKTVAFSPDGTLLATASLDGTARLWDSETGEALGGPLCHQGTVHAAAFSPDGKLLASASEDGTARIWTTSRPGRVEPFAHPATVLAVAFSPDGKSLATGAEDGVARLWDLDLGQSSSHCFRHDEKVSAVAFRPDGKVLATGSYDHTTRFWDPQSGQPCGIPWKHADRVSALAFSPVGNPLAVGLLGGEVYGGNPFSPELPIKLFSTAPKLYTLAFRQDGKLLATGAGWNVQLWDVGTRKPRGSALKRGGRVQAVPFSPDGRRLAIGSQDGITQLWDLDAGRADGPPLRHEGEVWSVAFSPDGKLLATAGYDNCVRLWDLSTSAPRHGFRLRYTARVHAVAFSPDGKLLAAAEGRNVYRWRLPREPAELREMQLRTWVELAARQNAQGEVEAVPWQEWRVLREELRGLEERSGGATDR
jgi:eukaryotic-like serine/threonine-protein kinase